MITLKLSPKAQAWAKATAQRVARSFAASLLSSGLVGGPVAGISWTSSLDIAAGAALATLLFCITGQATGGDGPAFGRAETTRG